jgi:hypothetical protein
MGERRLRVHGKEAYPPRVRRRAALILVSAAGALACACHGGNPSAGVTPSGPEAAPPSSSVPARPVADTRIVVDLARLTAFGMAPHDFVVALRDGGVAVIDEQRTEIGGMQVLRVNVVAGPTGAAALGDVVVRVTGGVPVRVKDVASVEAVRKAAPTP